MIINNKCVLAKLYFFWGLYKFTHNKFEFNLILMTFYVQHSI